MRALLAALALAWLPLAAARARVVRLDTALGPERVLVLRPAHPRATLVMLPGGTGRVGLTRTGRFRHGANFLVRTRRDWVRRGFAVVIPDAPGGRDLRGHRHGPGFAAVVGGLVRLARRRIGAPVILFGTSQGTIGAVNGAAHAAAGSVAGVVLTETVSVPGRLSRMTVFDADPAAVRAPVLIVANRDDRCPVAPPGQAPVVARALGGASSVTVRMVAGGAAGDRPCGSLGPHGYFGIEGRVETAIAGWIGTLGLEKEKGGA